MLVLAMAPAGCATAPGFGHWWLSDQECMARVMYFESNRSSDDGMLAVGTVVMNRVRSDQFPNTVCGVVGQPNQFAAGALDKPMNGPGRDRAERIASEVLAGARHPGVGNAMYFHTAGYTYPYSNMHYVLVAGGNAFYEKTDGQQAYSQAYAQTYGQSYGQSYSPAYAQGYGRSYSQAYGQAYSRTYQPMASLLEQRRLAEEERLSVFLQTGQGM